MARFQLQHYVAGLIWVLLMGLGYLYFDSRARPAAHVTHGGEISIPRSPDGHFYIAGTINSMPVTFLVDTGASSVSVNREQAQRLGLAHGHDAQFETAGGTVRGQIFDNVAVEVGGLRVDGLRVGGVPNMGAEALLGQNFLRHFDVVIRGDALVLRAQVQP
jgi:aspartyl protease family protein